MGLSKRLSKRLTVLEARQTPSDALGDRWPPTDCDPARCLARYTAYFEGLPWDCTGPPTQKVRRDTRLARYKAYFDQLEVGASSPRWEE